ncbi:hypothetical protein [Sabulicella rubraurantiaca]|uniref:hypothetical protein n=1 Tax=Sabulicella rubraurantiaca TaxID=2811429 RepID=UPI001A969CEF|nr:hypothetical protein [Sabulicella rubraurantiaca]
MGAARPAHVLTPTSNVRRIVNMTALYSVDADGPGAAAETTAIDMVLGTQAAN